MNTYLELLQDVMKNGTDKGDRTGTGTRSVFGRQIRFDLSKGFPLLTTKSLHLPSIVHELLWFISGDTNVKYLQDNGVSIWNEWADEHGDLGPVYGKQWRDIEIIDGWGSFRNIDQLSNAIDLIRNDPNSRRIIVDSWQVPDLDLMALTPCHCLFQFYVENGRLSCQLYQRSADLFLGVPFNIASYALLVHMVAQACKLEVGDFVHTFGDLHIYSNHFEQVQTQLSRCPKPLPTLMLNPEIEDIFNFRATDITFVDYDPYPKIPAKVSV